jgi:hypothetical protein
MKPGEKQTEAVGKTLNWPKNKVNRPKHHRNGQKRKKPAETTKLVKKHTELTIKPQERGSRSIYISDSHNPLIYVGTNIIYGIWKPHQYTSSL